MARYTGPRTKKSRRLGQILDDNAVRNEPFGFALTNRVASQLSNSWVVC